MANSSRDKTLYQKYVSKMKSILNDKDEKSIYAGLCAGKNTYMRLDRVESSSFDSSWIDKIEGVIFDLGEIIKIPRSNTKSVSDLSPIELAKKINGESVQHLASHTQYIKEVDDYGNVIPSKILSFSNEDNILTYENRFIATFIRKLMLFIEKRYEFVLNFASLHDEEVLYLKNHSYLDDAEVEIETKIKVKSVSDTEVSTLNADYFHRISEMRRYILYYYNSPFMKLFKTERNVRNPILQTNIIRKNVKYHHCYEVYRYIESYSQLGVSYKMDEQYSQFSPEDLKELNYSLLASYLSVQGKDKAKTGKGVVKEYKPHILTSFEDESFIYGPYLRGPIQFVRADEGYINYLEKLVNKELPLHPNKAEKEYYKDEYEARKDVKEFAKQVESLVKRQERNAHAFDKVAEKIVAEREAAKESLAKQNQAVIEQEETDLLNKVRAQIVKSAIDTWSEAIKLEQAKEEARKAVEAEEASQEDKPVEEPVNEPEVLEKPKKEKKGKKQPKEPKATEPKEDKPVEEAAPEAVESNDNVDQERNDG